MPEKDPDSIPQPIPNHVFREYDIRGNADTDLTDDFVYAFGCTFGETLQSKFAGGHHVAIGRDCRLSSDRIFTALVRGLTHAGVHVIDIGIVPSPCVYFSAHHLATTASIVVTGSHNPRQDNGFKMMLGTAPFFGEDLLALRDRMHQIAAGNTTLPHSTTPGSVAPRDIQTAYLHAMTSALRLGQCNIHVVVDAGNGSAGPLAVAFFRSLGLQVTPLYCDMDGTFPNHHPDPTVTNNLQDLIQKVADTQADIGLAFDGDGDRLGAVDAAGNIYWGDDLLLLLGRQVLRDHPGATIIGEVKCSQTVFDALTEAGGNPIMWKVGHSNIKKKMSQTGAMLAGEMSGHIFFADRYYGYDDALYAGARLIEELFHHDTSLSELGKTIPQRYATPEIRIPCERTIKQSVVSLVKQQLLSWPENLSSTDIDGVRVATKNGWLLLRPSQTQDVIVIRVEANSNAEKVRLTDLLTGWIDESTASQTGVT